jgi:hypothetical protein
MEYLKYKFILNSIAMVGIIYDFFIDDIKYIYITLLVFFRFYSIFNIDAKIVRRLSKRKILTASYEICYLFVFIFFVGHLIACIFMGVSINLYKN